MFFIKQKSILASLLVFALVFSGPSLVSAAPKYTIKVGLVVSEMHPDYITANRVLKKKIEAGSKGAIKVELYPNAQLGADREMIESLQLGTLTMGMPASSALGSFERRFQVLDLPFLFKDKQMAFRALDGKLGKKLDSFLPQHGMLNLGYFENGFRHVTNNRKPIQNPEDMKGLKIRTMENPMHIAFFKLLGTNPTPMNYGEVYTALQQKTIDAAEMPIALVYDAKFYEVQKYYSLTGHLFSATMLIASKPFMDKLPKDLHALVVNTAREFCLENRKAVDTYEKKYLAEMEKKGLKVNRLSAADKEKFIQATSPVYEQFRKQIGADVIDLAQKAAGRK